MLNVSWRIKPNQKNNGMKKLSPILWTKDLEQTISFYTSVLGFKAKSNFPNFVSLTRGIVEIMFVVPQDEPEECIDASDKKEFFPRPVLTGSIFIVTDQVDKLWDSVKDKATVKTSIANRDYLMRDFSIVDNNGYELVFGQDIG
jgi:catechol 2,3-dioxygenase-like lactoylglutathione lyase family enzyme